MNRKSVSMQDISKINDTTVTCGNISVSIIIPVYNVEKYILRCLQSVAAQTISSGIECIIVDDCGTDNSMLIAENFVNDYSGDIGFRIIHNEKNKGLSGTRNNGISHALGEYVYFLDSDDEITPKCMEGYLEIVDRYPGVDVVQGLFENDTPYMKQFLNKKIVSFSDDPKVVKRLFLDYDAIPVAAANKLIRAGLIREHNLYFKEGIVHEDNYWAFFMAKHVKSFALYPQKCYIYYTNPNSIMTAPDHYKENKAYSKMLTDFVANVDQFLIGEQKKLIMRLLISFKDSEYYDSKEQLLGFIEDFKRINTPIERIILQIVFSLQKNNYMRNKFINIASWLYNDK